MRGSTTSPSDRELRPEMPKRRYSAGRGLRPFKARGLLTAAVGGVSKPCGSLKMTVSLIRKREMAPVTASTLRVNRWSRVA